MKFDGENGKRRPAEGRGAESSADDQAGSSIGPKRSKELGVLRPRTEATGIGVQLTGPDWAGFEINPYATEEPVGLAVLDLNDELELIVFVSARRKRGGS